MDPVRFDALTRALGQVRGRRHLVSLLTALPLIGVLTGIPGDEAAAERPRDRMRRHKAQRRRKQRNRKQRNRNDGNNGNSNNGNTQNPPPSNGNPSPPPLGSTQCGSNGAICFQDSDCCTNNCFNFECAARVLQCSQGGSTTNCRPPAKGCAGLQCCYGAVSCNEGCCQGPANQCNPQGACCAPNCAGRQCGDDGCGAGGTCGTCPSGQTCNPTSGQCEGPTVCGPQSCPNGCCDAAGQCQPGGSLQVCGIGGLACKACPSAPPNATATCSHGTCGYTCDFDPCGSTCCPSNQHCDAGPVCCTFLDDPCTTNAECCASPINFCKTEGNTRFCCRPSSEPCNAGTAFRCCSGQCNEGQCT